MINSEAIPLQHKKSKSPAARVLVIEDDPDTGRGVQVNLAAAGFEVYLASQGDQSVATAQVLKPDLILLDLGLPGIDGLEVLSALEKVMPKTPVAVVSARSEVVYEPLAFEAGAVLYLQKASRRRPTRRSRTRPAAISLSH